jgi:hypothetical protein
MLPEYSGVFMISDGIDDELLFVDRYFHRRPA